MTAVVTVSACSGYSKNSEDNLSHVMRKPDFCICKNKDADRLHSGCAADQRRCFHYIYSTVQSLYFLNTKF